MIDIELPPVVGEKDGWPVVHYDFGARRRLHGFHRGARRAARAQPVLVEHVRARRVLDDHAPRRGARGLPAPRGLLQRLDRPARPGSGVSVHPDADQPARPREVPPGAQRLVLARRRRPHHADRPGDLHRQHRAHRRRRASATSSPTSPCATRPRCSSASSGCPSRTPTCSCRSSIASSSPSTARTRRRSPRSRRRSRATSPTSSPTAAASPETRRRTS